MLFEPGAVESIINGKRFDRSDGVLREIGDQQLGRAQRGKDMSNPYQPPSDDIVPESRTTSGIGFEHQGRIIAYGFGGAVVGDILLVLMARVNAWPFTVLGKAISGRISLTNGSIRPLEICLVVILITLFVLGGAFLGVWMASKTALGKEP